MWGSKIHTHVQYHERYFFILLELLLSCINLHTTQSLNKTLVLLLMYASYTMTHVIFIYSFMNRTDGIEVICTDTCRHWSYSSFSQDVQYLLPIQQADSDWIDLLTTWRLYIHSHFLCFWEVNFIFFFIKKLEDMRRILSQPLLLPQLFSPIIWSTSLFTSIFFLSFSVEVAILSSVQCKFFHLLLRICLSIPLKAIILALVSSLEYSSSLSSLTFSLHHINMLNSITFKRKRWEPNLCLPLTTILYIFFPS